MSDDKIRMPSGQGGLTRYFDDFHSKVELSPGLVLVLTILVIIMIILLHLFGGAFLT